MSSLSLKPAHPLLPVAFQSNHSPAMAIPARWSIRGQIGRGEVRDVTPNLLVLAGTQAQKGDRISVQIRCGRESFVIAGMVTTVSQMHGGVRVAFDRPNTTMFNALWRCSR